MGPHGLAVVATSTELGDTNLLKARVAGSKQGGMSLLAVMSSAVRPSEELEYFQSTIYLCVVCILCIQSLIQCCISIVSYKSIATILLDCHPGHALARQVSHSLVYQAGFLPSCN